MTGEVLALSGGGFRGLYTVRILKKLEERIGKPLGKHFDLITGTSIGGIIALGIAAGIPLSKIEQEFIDKGMSIFPKPVLAPISGILRPLQPVIHWWRKTKAVYSPIHSSSGLENILRELFGDLTMKDLHKAHVAITAANLSTGGPKMFKTPHHEEIYLDADIKVRDVALATSAAPVYFPIHEIEDTQTFFADGALMGNAPGLFGWLEAKTRLNIPESEISVLAVGTLAGTPSISSSTQPNKGALFWLSPGKLRLLTFLMSQQEQLTNHMLKLLLGLDRYHLIDGSLSDEAIGDIDLDDASTTAQKTLISHAEKHFAEFTNTEFCKTYFPRKEVL
jgi:Patatin